MRARSATVILGAVAVAGGLVVAGITHRPVEQGCSGLPPGEICSPIYGGRHDAAGLPSVAISAAMVGARTAALPQYPGSGVVGLQDVAGEQALHLNGRRGYQGARATLVLEVSAKPGEMLVWYRDRMRAQGWKDEPVNYGAPQLTVRSFLRGREGVALSIHAADYLPAEHLTYDLAYSIDPFVCDGRGGCGDLGARSDGGM